MNTNGDLESIFDNIVEDILKSGVKCKSFVEHIKWNFIGKSYTILHCCQCQENNKHILCDIEDYNEYIDILNDVFCYNRLKVKGAYFCTNCYTKLYKSIFLSFYHSNYWSV